MTRRREGLTIIEVAVALALLAGVLVGVFAGISVALRADAAAREHRAASDAAFTQLELRLADDFDAVVGAPATGFHVRLEAGHREVVLTPASRTFFDPGEDDPTMAGHVRVVTDPDAAHRGDEASPSNNLLEVRVTVAWRSHDGTDQRVDVVSRRAR